jgi:LysM repeat protein
MAAKKPPKPLGNLTVDKLKPPVKRTPSSIAKLKPAPAKKDARYTVKRGDSLSKIAKANGTTLANVLKLNPRLRNDPKYAGGNRIFSGTKVRLK